MTFADLIPTTMGYLGSLCLGIAVVLVLLEVPGKGINWNKVAGIFAVIGGFGVLGGAGGWIGNHIWSAATTSMSTATEWASRIIGGGAGVVVLGAIALWAYSQMASNGVEAGGKGKWSKRIRSLIKAGVLAVCGAGFALAIPQLYSLAGWLVGTVGGGAQNLIA